MKKKAIVRLLCTIAIVATISIGMFSGQALAVRYSYYTDAYDGVSILHIDTTTNSATLTFGIKYIDYSYPWGHNIRIIGYKDGMMQFSIPPGGTGTTSRMWWSRVIMSNLTPGTAYIPCDHTTGSNLIQAEIPNGSYLPATVINLNSVIYTEPVAPSAPYFSNITQFSSDIEWSSNGNGSATNYRLYRSLSKYGPWTLLYDGPITSFTDENLKPDTTYYYVVKSYTPVGAEKASEIIPLTTAQDPAVAAATAAKNSADAAMIASQKAEQATYTMVDKVTAMEGKIDELSKLTQDRQAPVILAFKHSLDKIRVTRNSVTPFLLSATDDRSDTLEYRYKINGGAFSDWQGLETGVVDLNLGTANGFKQIVVEVKDESGKTTSASTSIFKI